MGTGKSQRTIHHEHWPNKEFVAFMRRRMVGIGIASARAILFTGHSLKRGSVQLLRTLELKDEYVMRRIKMEGGPSYLRYIAAFNASGAPSIPDFASIEEMKSHMRECDRRKSVMGNAKQFELIADWIEEKVSE